MSFLEQTCVDFLALFYPYLAFVSRSVIHTTSSIPLESFTIFMSPHFSFWDSSRAWKPKWREINHQMVLCSANGSFIPKNPFSKGVSTPSDSRLFAAFCLFPYPFKVSSFLLLPVPSSRIQIQDPFYVYI